MQYREHLPCAALRPYVQCYWTLRGRTHDPKPQFVFPDGHMEIIFHLGEPFSLVSDTGIATPQACTLIAGQIRRPLALLQPSWADVVAIRFQPGGAAAFVRFPQQEIAGDVVNLEDFWGTQARSVRDALGSARSAEIRIHWMEKFLLEMRPPAPVSLGLLSQRHYRRRFEETVGLTPKLFERIRRFQTALSALGRKPIADVALECGYYDQAHLIRDFKQFAGQTPAAWLRAEEKNVLFFQDALQAEALS